MDNAQLDQLIYALVWKAGPVLILCGIGWLVLRELLRRIGRRAARHVHEPRTDQASAQRASLPLVHPPDGEANRAPRPSRWLGVLGLQ